MKKVYKYTKVGWSQPISTEEDTHIQSCLKDLSMAKINCDLDVADDIRDQLQLHHHYHRKIPIPLQEND